MIIPYSWTLSVCFLQFVTTKAVNTTTKDGKYLSCPDLPPIPHGSITKQDGTYIAIKCDTGYKLTSDTYRFKCDHITGKWKNLELSSLPRCAEHQSTSSTCSVPHFPHSVLTATSGSHGVQFCFNGYSIIQNKDRIKSLHVECHNNQWYYLGTSVRVKDCFEDPDAVKCGVPPEVEKAFIQNTEYSEKYNEGDKVYYQCDSGYRLLTPDNYITCRNGHWLGTLPYCEELKGCKQPPQISHAKWRVSEESYYPRVDYVSRLFPVGTHVIYSCMYEGYFSSLYTLVGERVIECQANGQWTRPPACISSQGPNYCSLPVVDNGVCICFGGEEECDRLTLGDKIECTCNTGYDISGEEILTCQGSTWDRVIPKCQIHSQDNTDSISVNEDGEPDRSHMNTLAIVVATACSVLGLLLLVMVAVVFRRRKPHHHHSRLYHQGMNAPPYQRVHNHHLEEHDRVALIGYESARLPTYEEATRTRSGTGVRTASPGNDYRPLPNIPTNILSSVQNHNNNNNNNNSSNNNLDNTSHHSMITTSTVNRDGVSEIFGSIDTVNFSTCASDASTSVTVDTLDSRTSRPSTSSGIATAGSLENVSSDDAPLLENTQQDTEDVEDTRSSTEDPEICSDREDKEV